MRFAGFTTLLIGLALCGACAATPPAPAAPAQLPTANVVVASPAATGTINTSAIRLRPPTVTPTSQPTPTSAATEAPAQPAPTEPLATPQASPTLDDAQATREALLVAEINRVRADNQLPPYRASAELSAAARAHSCDLATHHTISHVSSDGRTLPERLAGSTPPWEWPSESIAAGTDDPVVVVAMWMDEPPEGWHRRNILDAEQREVGAGYCVTADDPSGNQFYWTADFSRRAEPSPQ